MAVHFGRVLVTGTGDTGIVAHPWVGDNEYKALRSVLNILAMYARIGLITRNLVTFVRRTVVAYCTTKVLRFWSISGSMEQQSVFSDITIVRAQCGARNTLSTILIG